MKKITSFVLSASLVFSAIPAFAESAQSGDSETGNMKKGSQKVDAVIQIPAKSVNKNNAVQSFKVNKAKKFQENELIVKFKNTSDVTSLGKVKDALGLKTKQDLGSKGTKLIEFKSGIKIEDAIKALKASSLVEYAEPNYLFYPSEVAAVKPKAVTDPLYGELWGLKNTGQSIDWVTGTAGIDIKAEGAWLKTQGSPNVVIAVIDSGTDINHSDLKNQIWKNPGETAGDGIDNDKNGYIDDVNGWDFLNNDKTVFDEYDGDEHGTHVSGTIAGTANSTGVIGVAPKVKIMPLKFIGPNGGSASDAILAINYAKAKGVKISNNSWGGSQYSQALYDAIKGSNSLFVAAAGNESQDIDAEPSYPAGYNLSNILSVAAIDNKGNVAYFSNYGAKNVDIAAPGVSIKSTVPKDWWEDDYTYAYKYMNGTSMAAPHATGVAALLQSANSSASPTVIKDSIMKTVTKLSSLTGVVGTGGLLNAQAAVNTQTDNDIPGKTFPGTTVSDTVNASTDLDDVYSLDLKQGEKVTVTLTGAAGTDFDLYLYKPGAKTVKSSDGIVAYSEKAGTSSETVTYIAPEAGKYYLDVYAYKGSGSYKATVKQGAAKGTYENTAKEIGYIGIWSTSSSSYASGKSYAQTNTGGSQVQFVFNGTGLSLRGLKNSKQGIAKITIDGVSSEVSLYSKSTVYKAEYFKKTGLKAGKHVVTIQWTGKAAKGARKASANINLDTIVVY